MKVLKYRFAIHSINPDRLAAFYKNVLGFEQSFQVNRQDEYGYSFKLTDGYKIWIAKHNKIKGKNKDPFRVLISLYVDSVDQYFVKIKNYDPNLIVEEPTEYCMDIPGEERKVCAFLDVDGNCIQMMQKYT